MEYGIQELSRMALVSTRTLRYYDEIGLLKPSRVSEAGYRFYGQQEVAILQQILFYRERGFELKTIRRLLYDQDFDMLEALEEHLRELEKRKAATEALIAAVEKTIQNVKGNCDMHDQEKFIALKETALRENEARFGEEARKKYGRNQVEGSNQKLSHMTDEQWQEWKALEEEILTRLETAVRAGADPDSEEAKQIALLHRQWLTMSVPSYSPQMHRGIAAMYVADSRFTEYYDRSISGCARLLQEAVQRWI